MGRRRLTLAPQGGFRMSSTPQRDVPMTEWEIIDALTDGDVSKFGITYRGAYEWLQERRQVMALTASTLDAAARARISAPGNPLELRRAGVHSLSPRSGD